MDWRMVTDRAACPYQSAKPRWTDPAASSDGKPVARLRHSSCVNGENEKHW